MKKKSNRLWPKILAVITLVVPTSLYIILSATLFNIKYDHRLDVKEPEHLKIVEVNKKQFLYTDAEFATFHTGSTYVKEVGHYGFYVLENEIVSINRSLVVIQVNKEGLHIIGDAYKWGMEQKTGFKIPLSFIISGIAVLIVILVVNGKMKFLRKHKRLGALISLLLITAMLYAINEIVANMLYVFVTFTSSWLVYYLEHLYFNGFKEENDIDLLAERLLQK